VIAITPAPEAVSPVYNVSAWGSSKEKLMSQVIPDKFRDLFNKRSFASLSTLMPDGSPQVTPVWCDIEGDLVIVNTAKGRQKDKNMRRDPRVALAIIADASSKSPRTVPPSTSTKWPRNISGPISIPTGSPTKCA
jgi:hypothetical protein